MLIGEKSRWLVFGFLFDSLDLDGKKAQLDRYQSKKLCWTAASFTTLPRSLAKLLDMFQMENGYIDFC
jgi:hypothetical protein